MLRTQLKLDAGLSIADVLEHAARHLGIESEMTGLNLAEKANKCLSQMQASSDSSASTSVASASRMGHVPLAPPYAKY